MKGPCRTFSWVIDDTFPVSAAPIQYLARSTSSEMHVLVSFLVSSFFCLLLTLRSQLFARALPSWEGRRDTAPEFVAFKRWENSFPGGALM